MSKSIITETYVDALKTALELVEYAPNQALAIDSLKRMINTLNKEEEEK